MNEDDIVDRLRCRYAMGPMIDGEPEFGWRDFGGSAPEGMVLPTPLMIAAANEIERLRAALNSEPTEAQIEAATDAVMCYVGDDYDGAVCRAIATAVLRAALAAKENTDAAR